MKMFPGILFLVLGVAMLILDNHCGPNWKDEYERAMAQVAASHRTSDEALAVAEKWKKAFNEMEAVAKEAQRMLRESLSLNAEPTDPK